MEYKCKLIERQTQSTLSIRTKSAVQDLPQVLGKAFGEIAGHMAEIGEISVGAPYVEYYNMDMQNLDIEIGFPVSKKLTGNGDIEAGEIPAGRYATTLYVGPYNGIEQAYTSLMKWISENNYTPTDTAYEFYLNDPASTPEEELQTEILFALK